jgi:transposase
VDKVGLDEKEGSRSEARKGRIDGMAMGSKDDEQEQLFVTYETVRATAGHPFYEALGRILRDAAFDRYVEETCGKFYAEKNGRPSLPPGVYFRCLLVGFFEGIESERGIAWRVSDSLSLRAFLGISVDRMPPNHSTLSKTRRRIDLETHELVFAFVLKIVAEHGLVKGKSLGVDATTLEANAAMRSLVRRDNGEGYADYMVDLAKASGIETPTRADVTKIDRKRPKKGSNKDWVNPNEPDAQVTKMKTGGTRLAHKHEHAVDMETGAIVGLSLKGGAEGDTNTVEETLADADANLEYVKQKSDKKTSKRMAQTIEELTLDKGYHSNKVLLLLEDCGIRGYVSEPNRPRRRWKDKEDERRAVYLNRQRLKRRKGKNLLKRRGELLERAMAHMFASGGMRRVTLRGHGNIKKRLLLHAAAFNLSLVMRALFGVGKPRCLQSRPALLRALLAALVSFAHAILGTHALPRELGGIKNDDSRIFIELWAKITLRFLPPQRRRIIALSTAC